jgi:hypothetical protein
MSVTTDVVEIGLVGAGVVLLVKAIGAGGNAPGNTLGAAGGYVAGLGQAAYQSQVASVSPADQAIDQAAPGSFLDNRASLFGPGWPGGPPVVCSNGATFAWWDPRIFLNGGC